ncbi:coenzyme PQQ synthesis C domain protein [Wolbachia endosymbiont of Brugia pahangi]|nr:coenzyme PQQ synthesis C domain protein [Wolbachia endosymbiont of Brugia pahangi]
MMGVLLQFFTVHMDSDKWHSEESTNLIADLDEKIMRSARKGVKLL